jgi:hypothetical protein
MWILAGLALAQDVVAIPGTPEIPPFAIQRAEVIWKDFERYRKEALEGITRPTAPDFLPPEVGILPEEVDAPNASATYLRWHAAVEYAAWLSKKTGEVWRLPTEAEWLRARAAGVELRDMDGGQWEYALESDRPEFYAPLVLRGLERQAIPKAWYEHDAQRPRSLWYLIGTPASAGLRLVRVENAEGREARAAAAAQVVVRVLRSEALKGRDWVTSIEAEVENKGPRALAEIELIVYALTPDGEPHPVDVEGLGVPGRPTFTRAWPALATSAAEARRPPLKPGETRRFHVEAPTSFDDDTLVDPEGWAGRAVSVRFTR